MPTELLQPDLQQKEEHPVEDSRAVDKTGVAQPQCSRPGVQETTNARPNSIWRRIFEGHEEFLGWTPD